ncbi:jg25633, partial [Pararge aegeria aegeria]
MVQKLSLRRYTVDVDSSVLGAACDGYEHRYMAVREQTHDPELFTPNIDDLCDTVEQLNSSSAAHTARLDPLKEFTLPHRDLRYDEAIEMFKTEYNRQYADGAEEALRKNLLLQHMRFTSAGNREGATF